MSISFGTSSIQSSSMVAELPWTPQPRARMIVCFKMPMSFGRRDCENPGQFLRNPAGPSRFQVAAKVLVVLIFLRDASCSATTAHLKSAIHSNTGTDEDISQSNLTFLGGGINFTHVELLISNYKTRRRCPTSSS